MLTLVVGEAYERVVSEGTASKAHFCELVGMDLIVDHHRYLPDWPIPWSKLSSIKKHLSQYDAIFHCDADVLITNYGFDIEQMLEIFWADDKDILINAELQLVNNDLLSNTVLNTGNFFIRNTPWAQGLLDTWLTLEDFKNTEYWEQDAFNHLYEQSADVREKTGVVYNQHLFNSFGTPFLNGWAKGDFLLHAARWKTGSLQSTFHFIRQFASNPQNWVSDLIGSSVTIRGSEARLCSFGLCQADDGTVLGEWFACGRTGFLIHPMSRRIRPEKQQQIQDEYQLIDDIDHAVIIRLAGEDYWWAYPLNRIVGDPSGG